MAFYELRQYFVLPGKMDEWVKIMEEEIIPFQVSKGMVICGSFRGETDESAYIWLRRFNSEAEREALYGKAQEIFKREAPWVPIAHSIVFMATRKGVSGYRMDPLGRQSFDGVDLPP